MILLALACHDSVGVLLVAGMVGDFRSCGSFRLLLVLLLVVVLVVVVLLLGLLSLSISCFVARSLLLLLLPFLTRVPPLSLC